MTRLLLLAPVGTPQHLAAELDSARRAVRPGTEVVLRHLPGLPETVYVPPEDLFIPVLVRAAVAAEREGFDAIGISCCSDPGLAEVRSAVRIPVTAPFEAVRSLLPALAPLSVLYVDVPPGPGESTRVGGEWVPALAAAYRIGDLLTEPLPIPVRRPWTDGGDHAPDEVGRALIEAQRDGLAEHGPAALARAEAAGACAVLLACTYWTGLTGIAAAHTRLPVLDPVELLARHAETLSLAVAVAA